MNAFDWVLIALWMLNVFLTITGIGKPKKPTTPGVAAFTVGFSAVLIIGLLFTRGVL